MLIPISELERQLAEQTERMQAAREQYEVERKEYERLMAAMIKAIRNETAVK